jgi:hypothetical protein
MPPSSVAENLEIERCCFVVSRIGEQNSAERIHADWFLEAIVEPVFEARPRFKVERADKIDHPGLIDAQVIQKLLAADLVVADITGLNPNVFYEIGIRHMAQKPIIHMHEVGERIPFDVSLYRSIPYSRLRPRDLAEARANLDAMVERALAPGYQVENPVTNARGRYELERHATPEQQVLIEQLRGIEVRLAKIEFDSKPTRLSVLVDHPVPNSAEVSFFSVGDFAKHPKFGTGQVEAVDGNKITVDFPVGRKKVVDAFLIPVSSKAG